MAAVLGLDDASSVDLSVESPAGAVAMAGAGLVVKEGGFWIPNEAAYDFPGTGRATAGLMISCCFSLCFVPWNSVFLFLLILFKSLASLFSLKSVFRLESSCSCAAVLSLKDFGFFVVFIFLLRLCFSCGLTLSCGLAWNILFDVLPLFSVLAVMWSVELEYFLQCDVDLVLIVLMFLAKIKDFAFSPVWM